MSDLNLSLHFYFMQVHVSVAEIVEQQLFQIISCKFESHCFIDVMLRKTESFVLCDNASAGLHK